MPKSEDVAAAFMSGGRGGDVSTSESFGVEVCYPEGMGQMGKWNASGRSNVVPAGVDYNPVNEDAIVARGQGLVDKVKADHNDNDADDAR